MPITLHADCKNRLKQILAEGLPKVLVDSGNSINVPSLVDALYPLENVLPTRSPIRNQLVDYVRDLPILTFVGERLRTLLTEKFEYDSEKPSVQLTRLDGFKDPMGLAQALVQEIESLPWRYIFSIRFPEKINWIFRRIGPQFAFGPDLQVETSKANLDRNFPVVSSDPKKQEKIKTQGRGGLLLAYNDPEWADNSSYLQIGVNGFINDYGTTNPVIKAQELLRSFCGLAIALQLVKTKSSFSLFPTKSYFLVHKKVGETYEIDSQISLEDHYTATFNELELDDLNGALDNEQKKESWGRDRLTDIAVVFSANERADKILLAAQWLFDSFTGRQELLSFMQAMVVLEILLGEKDKKKIDEIGLGELLRNRCAYLIGKTHSERAQILNNFTDIYYVRSQIVHRGKSRLTLQERVLFDNLRRMCRRVLQEEVKLLKADSVGPGRSA